MLSVRAVVAGEEAVAGDPVVHLEDKVVVLDALGPDELQRALGGLLQAGRRRLTGGGSLGGKLGHLRWVRVAQLVDSGQSKSVESCADQLAHVEALCAAVEALDEGRSRAVALVRLQDVVGDVQASDASFEQ